MRSSVCSDVGLCAALRYSCSPVELLGLDLGPHPPRAASADSVASAGVTNLAALDTAPPCECDGDTDLSAGPWQRASLSRKH